FCPSRWFINVDLPTLGRPTMATMPQRWDVSLTMLLLQPGHSGPGSGLFGLASARAGGNKRLIIFLQPAFDIKLLFRCLTMYLQHLVFRQGKLAPLQPFLQRGLRVLVSGVWRDLGE